MRIILKPLSKIYASLMRLRHFLYIRGYFKVVRCNLPVICVGNVSAGGSGKTPLCILLSDAFAAKGYSPVVLSRGYGGRIKGPQLIASNNTARECGDEALLIARKTGRPVIVSANRAAGAKFVESHALGDLIIMDDGFQHFALYRNADIVLVNADSEKSLTDFTENRVLPWGLLREERAAALSRADFILLSHRTPKGRGPDARLMQCIPKNRALFNSYFEALTVTSVTDGKLLVAQAVVAFCAIANPQSFFETLESMGFSIAGRQTFADHHFISPQEIADLRLKFPKLPLVCTEKDAVRLDPCDLTDIYKVEGRAKVAPNDAFLVQIEKKLKVGAA